MKLGLMTPFIRKKAEKNSIVFDKEKKRYVRMFDY